jgi:hypothetical protein
MGRVLRRPSPGHDPADLPIFYTSVLGLNKEFIGLIEGALVTVVSLTS